MAQDSKKPALMWFRDDLRLEDNHALSAACSQGSLILLYIDEQHKDNPWPKGGAFRWWRHHSLQSLSKSIRKKNHTLILKQGNPENILLELVEKMEVEAVYWNRRFEPFKISVDKNIKSKLKNRNIEVKTFRNHILLDPWQNVKDDKSPYKVFTPFWKKLLRIEDQIEKPLKSPTFPKPNPQVANYSSENLEDWNLLPDIDWDKNFYEVWQPGEKFAKKSLQQFTEKKLSNYDSRRDFPAIAATSRMSPHLAHGEITARQIWHEIKTKNGQISKIRNKEVVQYAKELVWRDFAYHLLFHFPQTTTEPLNQKFTEFPWQQNGKQLHAWQRGSTGYPIVDAGMRELWQTGWMHNRVRMIVASFLVKHLRIHWLEGARWFWDTLVDADLASNTMGWQWAAGCGADAAPYFRIFNPIIQGAKFDEKGEYTKTYVLELADVPAKNLFEPWKLSAPPKGYANPVVLHTEARIRALNAYDKIKG